MFGRYSSVALVTALGVIVSVSALAGPAQARPTVVVADAEGSGEITSLIVAYEPGAAPTDSNGDVTGAVAVPDAELAPGKALGFGLRTVSFDEPTSTAEAEVLADQLAASPQVAWAEPNYRVSVSNDQANPSWGLDRIDQHSRPLDGVYRYDSSGTGVTAYIVDTGIRSTQSDFGGRVAAGYSPIGGGTEDCYGHGTHVAGIVAGTMFGVAKAATLVPIRVLSCDGSGYMSDVVLGLNWAVGNHAAGTPAVLNMSLGGAKNDATNSAVAAAVADGITVVVAAGNSTDDACKYSPASAPSAITVNASDSADHYASFSNFGECTDIYAPGVSITSDYFTSDTATLSMSGTSMAAPHVAGVAARMLGVSPSMSPADVWAAMRTASTAVTFGRGDDDANRLLYADPVLNPTAPGVPLNPAVAARDASADVTWTAPSSSGGRAITGYTAKAWTQAVNGNQAGSCQPTPATGTACTITGLTNGTSYHVSVYATNTMGDGTSSSRIAVTPTVSVPSAPRAVATTPGDESAIVQWTAPISNGGRAITGYTAQAFIQAAGGTRKGTCQPTPATGTTCTITGLTNGTTYYVDVLATTSFGDGSPSGRVSVLPAAPAAAAPPASGGGSSGGSSGSSGGSSSGSGGGGAAAEVTEVRPAFGPVTGGTRILVLGFGFWGASSVTVGGVPATSFRYIDAATLEVVTPAGVAGWQQVVVTLAVGRATATFRYEDAPTSSGTPPVATTTPASPPPVGLPPAASRSVHPKIVKTVVGRHSISVVWNNASRPSTSTQIVTVYSQGKVVKSMHVEPGSSRVVVRGLPADRTYTVKVTVVLTGGIRSTSSASRSIHI